VASVESAFGLISRSDCAMHAVTRRSTQHQGTAHLHSTQLLDYRNGTTSQMSSVILRRQPLPNVHLRLAF